MDAYAAAVAKVGVTPYIAHVATANAPSVDDKGAMALANLDGSGCAAFWDSCANACGSRWVPGVLLR